MDIRCHRIFHDALKWHSGYGNQWADFLKRYKTEEPEFIPIDDFAEQIKHTTEYKQFHTEYDTSVAMLNNP